MTRNAPESLRRRAAYQMAYDALLVFFVIWPNLKSAPSLVLLVAAGLAAVWLLGGLAAWARVTHADELLLCGAAAPVLLGLTQLVYRLHFVCVYGALTRPGIPTDSSLVFLALWAAEMLLVLVPGVFFFWSNFRALSPVPPFQPKRPSATKNRT